MWSHLLQGLDATVGSWSALAYLAAGVLLGVVVGVLPGLSGVVVISIALVFVYKLDLQATLVFFLGVHAAGTYSASISSILLNTPAHPESVPVGIDGYPMSRRGEGARALGISAASTAVSGIVGGILLVLAFHAVDTLGTLIHPPDMVAIIVLAMFLVATLGVRRTSKAVISIGLGFLLASIGTSHITGQSRFTFDSIYLLSGVSLAVVAIGTFAIPQMVELYGIASRVSKRRHLLADGTTDPDDAIRAGGSLRDTLGGVAEALRHWVILLRSTVIGFFGGVIPGVGGFATNYISYGVSRQLSRKRGHLYGTGIPEGIIAAEGSSLAKEEGSKVMSLGLGLPTGTASALFIVALAIQGVQPGIGFIDRHPVQAYEIVWVLVICTLLGTLVGVLAGPQLARITQVPGVLLFPFVVAFCLIGVYIADVTYLAMGEIVVFGVVGLMLRRLGYSLGAYMMGVVMGPALEQNVYLSHTLNPGWSVFTRRPVADVIAALSIIVLVLKVREVRRNERAAAARTAAGVEGKRRGVFTRGGKESRHPLLDVIVTSTLVVLSLVAGIYSLTHYDGITGALPEICSGMILLGGLWQLPRQVVTLAARRADRTVAGDRPVLPVVAPTSPAPAGLPPTPDTGSTAPRPATSLATAGEPVLAAAGGPAPHGSALTAGITTVVEDAAIEAESDEPDDIMTSADGSLAGAGIRRRSWGRNGQYTREVVAVAWIAGSALLCYLLGFRLGIAIFAVGYALFAASHSLYTMRRKVIFAAASVLVLYNVVSLLFQALGLYEDPYFFIPVPTF